MALAGMTRNLALTAALIAAGTAGFWASAYAQQPAQAQQAEQVITLASGDVGSTYYATAGKLCEIVNGAGQALHCVVVPSTGSGGNVELLRAGKADIGLVQSDWQYQAYSGVKEFEGIGPMNNLRSVMSLYAIDLTIFARDDAGIRVVEDLRGKHVNLGAQKSNARLLVRLLLASLGWGVADFENALEVDEATQKEALCDGSLAAGVIATVHPSRDVSTLMHDCPVSMVPLTGVAVEGLVSQFPYYAYDTLPAGTYPEQNDNVQTFGVRATIVSRAGVSPDLIYSFLTIVGEHLQDLAALHPAFGRITLTEAATAGLTAPLHDGARRYYSEKHIDLPNR